jgi:hypothetical protein
MTAGPFWGEADKRLERMAFGRYHYRKEAVMPEQHRVIREGDVVRFTDRWRNEHHGVVVRKTAFVACGTIRITVFAPFAPSRVYGLSLGNFQVIEQPDDERRAELLDEAAACYRAHLSRYGAWAAMFEENPDQPVFL